jgi:DHA2 family multidrug resistance protein
VAGLLLFVIRELTTEHPVVDLRALKDRSFSTGVFLVGMLGFVLYASLVLLPIYVQTLLGYPAYQAGLALSPRGLGALLTTPLAGYLTSKTDARRLLIFGLILGSITMFNLSGLNLNAGYNDILWPQILQGIALSFLFIPLMASSMARIPKERMGNATSIFNLMRNIGGSFGIAIMTTFLVRRSQLHQSQLVERVTATSLETRHMVQGLQGWFQIHGADSYSAHRKAIGGLYRMVQQHASMISFVEAFWMMGIMFLAMVPFIFLLRNPRTLSISPPPPAPESGTAIPMMAAEEDKEELLIV